VAYAARAAGVPCEVFMPADASIAKTDSALSLEARVHVVPGNVDEAVRAAREHAQAQEMAFVHPFDDPDVIAGQGTLGLELVEDVEELAKVVIPVGGGGLAAGVAIAIKSQRPDVQLVQTDAGRYDLFAPSGKYEIELGVPGSDRVTEWVSVTTGVRRQEVIAPDILFESGSAALDQQTLTSTTKKTYKVEERTEFEIVRTDGSVVAFRKIAGRDVWRETGANQKLDLDYGGAVRVNRVDGMILKDAQDLFIPNRVTPAGSGVDDKSAFVLVGGTWQPYGTVRDHVAAK